MIIDKDNIKLILIILVVSLGIGYAYINSDLNINGTAKIKNANWDVHWANVQVKSGSVTGTNVVTAPTISNSTTVNFSVVLPTPGDYYEFTVDAVNEGSIDAMIDQIDSKVNGESATNLPDYLSYTVTYSDDMELEENHLLAASSIETYRVRIKYKDNITVEQLPSTDQAINLKFSVTYRQANSNSITVNHGTAIYTTSSETVTIGEALPSTLVYYSTPEEAIAEYGNDFCLKHIIKNGVVSASYVVFIISQATVTELDGKLVAGKYELRGLNTYDGSSLATGYCKREYYDSVTGICMSPYYERNKETLNAMFNNNGCEERLGNIPSGNIKYYHYDCGTASTTSSF